MKWIKKGLVFCPNGEYDWMTTHASPVTSILLSDCIRIFFSTRGLPVSGNYTSRIGYVDFDPESNTVLRKSEKPVLQLGKPGTFDEHGTMVAEVVKIGDEFFMYYMGWQRIETVPYLTRLGLAKSNDCCVFEKISDGPILGMSKDIPHGIGNISILQINGLVKMWYTHYTEWKTLGNGYRPDYKIAYIESRNGIDFGHRCDSILPFPNESIATPCVRLIGDKYYMWYSKRPTLEADGSSGKYSIGLAQSDDGQQWERKDEQFNLVTSENGWDSQMICYPDIIKVEDNYLMFYCGNGFGAEGFGYAVLDKGI